MRGVPPCRSVSWSTSFSSTPQVHVCTPKKTDSFRRPVLGADFRLLLSRRQYPNASCDYDRLASEHALEHQATRNQIRCSCKREARESIDILEDRRVSGENRKRSARRVTHECIVLHLEVAQVACCATSDR